jgi:hypothetical protein
MATSPQRTRHTIVALKLPPSVSALVTDAKGMVKRNPSTSGVGWDGAETWRRRRAFLARHRGQAGSGRTAFGMGSASWSPRGLQQDHYGGELGMVTQDGQTFPRDER